jgi:hypothetical protein
MAGQVGRPHEFFRVGAQLYVAGRTALLSNYQAAPILFHQAFELILKADLLEELYQRFAGGWEPGLSQRAKAAAIKDYNREATSWLKEGVGHDLNIAWDLFKSGRASLGLGPFDPVVADLHRWWSIRYPGFPTSQALTLALSRIKFQGPAVVTVRGSNSDQYQLSLEDMDELFTAIATLDWSIDAIKMAVGGGSVDPSAGARAYKRANLHPAW